MIQPLRRWHRRLWLLLTALVAVLLVAAALARRPFPTMERLPAASASAAETALASPPGS